MSLLRTGPEAKSCDGVLAEEDWLRSKQLEMIHVARGAMWELSYAENPENWGGECSEGFSFNAGVRDKWPLKTAACDGLF
jgi:hypothetical protein